MNLRTLGTILLSVLLSAGVTIWINSHQKRERPEVLQTKSIQLVDDLHRVRGIIGLTRIDGHEQPQIVLHGEDGQISVLLSLNERGEGTLYFNSKGKEGKVGIGYLWGSDVSSSGEEDPLGAWGLRVLGKNGQATAVGIGNTGKFFEPTH